MANTSQQFSSNLRQPEKGIPRSPFLPARFFSSYLLHSLSPLETINRLDRSWLIQTKIEGPGVHFENPFFHTPADTRPLEIYHALQSKAEKSEHAL